MGSKELKKESPFFWTETALRQDILVWFTKPVFLRVSHISLCRQG